jgi:pyruvate dehydrogenase E1 component alpha subunit
MILDKESELKIFKKAALCRAFEEEAYRQIEKKNIKVPAYLSAGQEYISATLAVLLESLGIDDKQIFIQHRGHSTYLAFGGDLDQLILELLGNKKGCSGGMGGSASIQSKEHKIYGHDGLMGSHGPIATGMCFSNRKFTLCFTGDAAAEEDYFLASIGWASTKDLPIWYIVEDNNLSILTEMHDVAKAFKINAHDVSDDPFEMWAAINSEDVKSPCLLNVRTTRLFWHAGAGTDNPNLPDRHKQFIEKWGNEIVLESEKIVKEAWERCLKL